MKTKLLNCFKSTKAGRVFRLQAVALLMAIVFAVIFIPANLQTALAESIHWSEGGGSAVEYLDGNVIKGGGDETEDEDGIPEDVYIIGEAFDKRDATEKHFVLSDGSYMMQDYGTDVHYIADGEWAEIDNTMQDDGSVFRNKQNSFQTEFNKDTESGSLLNISENGIQISLSYAGESKNRATVSVVKDSQTAESQNIYKEKSGFQTKQDFFASQDKAFKSDVQKNKINESLYRISDGVRYAGLLNNTDFEYIVEGRSVKENIIINAPNSVYEYVFELTLTNAYAELDEYGNIIIYDVSGIAQYKIPKGYMYDADAEYSYDIGYEIELQKNGSYLFKVIPDRDWLDNEERVYPVTIDPTVEAITGSGSYSVNKAMKDGTLYNNNDFTTYARHHQNTPFGTVTTMDYALIKYDISLDNYIIKNATLTVGTTGYEYFHCLFNGSTASYTPYSSTERFGLYCHILEGDWGNKNNVLNAKLLDSDTRDGSDTVTRAAYSFNVTEYARSVAKGINHGLRIAPHNDPFMVWKKATLITPVLTVAYKESRGLQPSDYYLIQDLGESGKGYVNTFNGQVMYNYDIMQLGNAALPIALSNIYDSIQMTTRPSDLGSASGTDWRLNMLQRLYNCGNGLYFYVDQTGREIALFEQKKITSISASGVTYGPAVIMDSEGLGLELTDAGGSTRLLTDRAGNVLTFTSYNTYYYLSSIKNNAGQAITITRACQTNPNGSSNALDISRITDSAGQTAGQTIDFIYENGNIKQLKKGTTLLATFNYSGNTLTSVVNNITGVTTSFEYTNNLLTKITTGSRAVAYAYGSSGCNKITETNIGLATHVYDITYPLSSDNITCVKDSLKSYYDHYCYNKEGILIASYSKTNGNKETIKSAYAYGVDVNNVDYLTKNSLLAFSETFKDSGDTATYYVTDKGTTQKSLLVPQGSTYSNSLTSNLGGQEYVVSLWSCSNLIGESQFRVTATYKKSGEPNIVTAFMCEASSGGTYWRMNSILVKEINGYYVSQINIEFTSKTWPHYIDDIKVVRINKNPMGSVDYDDNGRITSQQIYNNLSSSFETVDYSYDAKGNVTNIQRGNQSIDYAYTYQSNYISKIVETTKGGSLSYSRTYNYNSDGRLTSLLDENGVSVSYGYDINNARVTETIDGVTTTYQFNTDFSRLTQVTTAGVTDSYTYDQYGALDTITSAIGNVTKFVYGAAGNMTAVRVGGNPIANYNYANGNLTWAEYNGQRITYGYTDNRLTTVTNAAGPTGITYNDYGQVTKIEGDGNGGAVYEFDYSFTGINSIYTVTNGNNTVGNLSIYPEPIGSAAESLYAFNGSLYEINATTLNSHGALALIERQYYSTTGYTYDSLNRLKEKSGVYSGSNTLQTYSYRNGTSGTTSQIELDKYSIKGTLVSQYKYGYNASGNIESIRNAATNALIQEFQYDSFDRLSVEKNYTLNRTFTYAYNNGGNITSRTEKNLSTGAVIGTYSYGYTNSAWKDQLTSYNGQDITYDAAGNPTSYLGLGLQWQNGRQLKQITGATYGGNNWGTITMEYDYSGHRTSKHREGGINTCDQYYYWQGDILLAEVHGGIFLYYYYDETGVCGFNRAGADYYFQKNILGDIIAIYNTNGIKVGSYEYDAWGNTTVTNYTSDIIADWNPFRYRGYYQDQETGFYYLISRYYDPVTGRFINADEPRLATLGLGIIQGSNLYSYCMNNPVMYTDETGESFIVSLLVAIGIGALVGGVIGGVTAKINERSFWGGFLSGALVGGALGAATILGGATALAIGGKAVAGFVTVSTFAAKGALLASAIGITAAVSFGAGVGAYAIEKSFNNEQFYWNEALGNGSNTALKGLTAFGVGMAMASGGAYNFLLKGAAKRTFGMMVTGGITRGLVSNGIKLIQAPWYYGV